MTTIYSIHDGFGCIGRCDSKCHNAENPECKCCCGGAFHGVGTDIAVADRNTLTDEDILDNVTELLGPGHYRVNRQPIQKELFE